LATITPATLTALQDAIHVKYEGNSSTPASTDDDWTVRLRLINDWINRWENLDGSLWRELWATASLGTVSGTTLSLPADYKFGGGFVKFVSGSVTTYYPIIDPNDAQVHTSGSAYGYITGKPGAYTLTIAPTPASGDNIYGATATMPYYKYATALSSASDVTECPDPYFLVHGVIADLRYLDNDGAGYRLAFQQAESRLGQMKVRNEMVPDWQDERIPERYNTVTSGGIMGI
jgi:hypothetical protein